MIMKEIGKLPPYTGLLSDYALKNFLDKGYDPKDTKYTILTVTVEQDSPVFQQNALDSKGRHLLDCWRIFRLAKMIKDDPLRSYSKIKVRIDFEEGEIKQVNYTIYPLRQE